MVTITYKYILHIIGLVLTFLTRKVQIDVLNDYHYNITIIIISSILLLVDTSEIFLNEYQTVSQYFPRIYHFFKSGSVSWTDLYSKGNVNVNVICCELITSVFFTIFYCIDDFFVQRSTRKERVQQD